MSLITSGPGGEDTETQTNVIHVDAGVETERFVTCITGTTGDSLVYGSYVYMLTKLSYIGIYIKRRAAAPSGLRVWIFRKEPKSWAYGGEMGSGLAITHLGMYNIGYGKTSAPRIPQRTLSRYLQGQCPTAHIPR